MPKSQTYMNRALQSRDPRFARVLGRLGYGTDLPGNREVSSPTDDLLALKKGDLVTLAEAEGVELAAGDTKAEIADKIIAHRSGVKD